LGLSTGGRSQLLLWLWAMLLLGLTWPSMVGDAHAQRSDPVAEEKVKAAYLSKFGAYVTWPDGAFARDDSPLDIGVMDSDALAAELTEMVAGRSQDQRSIRVRRVHEGDSLAGLHVLFVGRRNQSALEDVLAAVKGQPTLTVTEAAEGLQGGGMINFVRTEGRLRFQVSPRAASASRLAISARLLAAALKVEGVSP
jgi:hypothetical protein